MFAIFFFIINTVVLLLSKIELTKNDVKIRNIFYSNYKNNLIGYSIGFGFIYSISIICSLIIISIIHIILAINFGNFNWINGKVIAFIIIEIVSSIAVSIIMTLNRKNDTLL